MVPSGDATEIAARYVIPYVHPEAPGTGEAGIRATSQAEDAVDGFIFGQLARAVGR